MKAMIRLVIASFVAVIVTVGASPAVKAGSATGTLELNGVSTPIRHAVALTRPAHSGTGTEYLVVLGASPVAAKTIAAAKSFDDIRGESTKTMTGVVALLRDGLDPWVELRDPSVHGQAGVTAFFVPAGTRADRIGGKLTGHTDYNGKPVKFNVTFDAPVIRKMER